MCFLSANMEETNWALPMVRSRRCDQASLAWIIIASWRRD